MASSWQSHRSERASKRIRASSANNISINDLPESVVLDIASYLPKVSQAILACSLTASTESFKKSNWKEGARGVGEKIISSHEQRYMYWQELDFGEVGPSLTSKLTDDDIGSILACLDSVNRLEQLALTGCYNITGKCLQPLRRSTSLWKLDISLLDQKDRDSCQDENISEAVVIPIMSSIISQEDSKLKYLQLPKSWRRKKSRRLHSFLEKYSRHLEYYGIECDMGHEDCDAPIWPSVDIDKNSKFYGLDKLSCYSCVSSLCIDCVLQNRDVNYESLIDEDTESERMGRYICRKCVRCYCDRCGPFFNCYFCGLVCRGCSEEMECSECPEKFCNDCVNEGKIHQCGCCETIRCSVCSGIDSGWAIPLNCSRCSIYNCEDCVDREAYGGVEREAYGALILCGDDACERMLCPKCGQIEYEKGEMHCNACKGTFAVPLLEKQVKDLQEEVEDLKAERRRAGMRQKSYSSEK